MLPRRTETRPSDSRMWMASRTAGGLTPNSPNKASCEGSTSPSFSRPDRTGCRHATARPRSPPPAAGGSAATAESSVLVPALAPAEWGKFVGQVRQRVEFGCAEHVLAEQEPRRRRDRPVTQRPYDVETQLGLDRRRTAVRHGQ